jgi:hypothetical protein
LIGLAFLPKIRSKLLAHAPLSNGRCQLPLVLTLGPQDCLELPDLAVCVCCGSNNVCRTFASVVGGCIRLAGTGGSLGHVATPLGTETHPLSAQVSSKLASAIFRIGLVLFVLLGDGLELVGLGMFRPPRRFGCLQIGVQLSRSFFGSVL